MLDDLKHICHYYLKHIFYRKKNDRTLKHLNGKIIKRFYLIKVQERYGDLKHGLYIAFNIDADQYNKGYYTEIRKYSEWYYENGKKVKCVSYYSNGNLMSIDHYEDGKLHGVSITYNSDGTEYRKWTYVRGEK